MNNNCQYTENRKDFIKQNYLSCGNIYVICIALTQINSLHSLFCALHLPSRKIIALFFKEGSLKGEDFTQTLQKIVNHKNFLLYIKIVHSDKGYESAFFKISFMSNF